jgi:translocator protein
MPYKLILALVITLSVGGIAGYATANAIGGWYATLVKPSFNPPNNIFAPVWTLLYIMMGIALYLIWKQPVSKKRNIALLFFGIQLFLNFWWSILFFNYHQLGWAFVEIIAMWVFIIVTIFAFAPLSKTAAWLLVPYVSWVSFASILNYAIWRLNT